MRFLTPALFMLSFANVLFGQKPIDRLALINRHNVHITSFDTLNSLSVGNGDFAFTVDATGLQTFPEEYKSGVPLGTMTQWAWHSFPNTENFVLEEVLREYDFHGRKVSYSVQPKETQRQIDAANYLRSNSHRLHLGNIGLEFEKTNGETLNINDIENIDQSLNLWTGEISSKFKIEGELVEVLTLMHYDLDLIAISLKSKLVKQGRLKIKIRFPYPTGQHADWACDFENPDKHKSSIVKQTKQSAVIHRTIDSESHSVSVAWQNKGLLAETSPHEFILTSKGNEIKVNILFSQNDEKIELPSYEETRNNSLENWENYWNTGGVVDFTGSTDKRAFELERRIVLSQYLTRIQCAGSSPPAETGLTYNSWYGKFHLEMHWWHAAHFAQWNHPELLEKSMGWYNDIVPKAAITAQRQGFDGIRWPKMVDLSGEETPSGTGQFLIWQQPHYIYFAEQLYRSNQSTELLNKYKDNVFATAEFMTSFAWFDSLNNRYVLGPNIIAAQETVNNTSQIINTPYELAYWYWGLKTAQQWRKRLHLPDNEHWDDVLQSLSELPQANAVYLAAETAPDSYTNERYMSDHPAVLGAYGAVPATPMIDKIVMKNTYKKIEEVWNWPTTWGWDYPMMAMNAVMLGEPEKAIDALLMDTPKNTYLKNGHNFQNDRLRIYLPGNGGLLMTVALMCAGYDGCDEEMPGIPKNGKWKVRFEGLKKLP